MCKPEFYFGVEPDARRVGLAKRLYPSHRFALFDEKRIPVENDSMDYIVVIAVFHHLHDGQIKDYLSEFERILKPDGRIIALEPCLFDHTPFHNRFMNWFDDGKYIRTEADYLNFFHGGQYQCQVLKKFTKGFVYNEILFSAQRNGS
ncbi:class I SAM-dependent methyltransferase [Paenibacillaceae bacterium WGS1546]|uniref:class I SAM-dependent methyltransferase n=1 Tax=Cohnella sp. WGS1546 TaxID=3366810 RepID=UPI00372D6F6C